MHYDAADNIVTLTMDDGKVNAMGHSMLDWLNQSLDQAVADKAGAVVLTGRPGMFSAGFDLKEFEKGPEARLAMVQKGFELLIRLYSLPLPLVAGCSGHGIALGAFILFASDNRVGVSGAFKHSLPETAISMELPPLLVSLAAARLTTPHLTRAALQSEAYAPELAVEAGFLDEVVEPEQLDARVKLMAQGLAKLPKAQYAANKLSIRAATLEQMRHSLEHQFNA